MFFLLCNSSYLLAQTKKTLPSTFVYGINIRKFKQFRHNRQKINSKLKPQLFNGKQTELYWRPSASHLKPLFDLNFRPISIIQEKTANVVFVQ